MDRTRDEPSHVAVVDALIARASGAGSPGDVVAMFRAAFEAVWGRAVTTLGSATLLAIAERVLHTATARHGFLVAVNPRPNGDARWKLKLQDRLATLPAPELTEGLRFALIELLTVIGRLTAEILTAELHAAIVASRPEVRSSAGPPAARSEDGERELS